MQTHQIWIWQQPDWPKFRWDQAALASILSGARLAQVLDATRCWKLPVTLSAKSTVTLGRTTHVDVELTQSGECSEPNVP